LREYAAKAALDNAKREADQRAAEFARQKRLDEIAKLTEESNARARALYGAKDQAKADYERELAQTQRDRAQRKCRFCSLPAKASSQ
jgi:hypothetical protein